MKRHLIFPFCGQLTTKFRSTLLPEVVLSSTRPNWPNLVVEEHYFPSRDLELNDFLFLKHVVETDAAY